MDYKELIGKLKFWSDVLAINSMQELKEILDDTADAIETLLAERDAAIKDMRDSAHHPCKICIHWKCGRCSRPEPKDCAGSNWWKWRGPQKNAQEERQT